LQKGQIARIFRVARELQKESRPKTVEGMILHDAHLIEGGRIFLAVKCLVTGLQHGDSLRQIIDYFDRRVDGRFNCCLPETARIYSETEAFARTFFHDLKKSL
jgi:uncharacterized protein